MTCANHPERQNVSFCQNCGKPLCSDCARTVGSAIFCEPCLAARIGGAPAPGGPYPPPPPPSEPGEPSPGLAAILGFIPGVGAMYNGQYAKGIVHLVVFALLVSIANHGAGIFGLFVAGWILYQVFDAHHTARARRDGTPLPNPFGLNDLGERMGFKEWSATAQSPAPPPAAEWTPNPSAGAPPNPPPPPPSSYSYNYSYQYQAPPVPQVSEEQMEEIMHTHANRFPAAAFWLIGLGLLFTLSNTHWFPHSTPRELLPLLLIGFGIWIFVRKMTGPRVFAITGSDTPAAQRMHLLWAINSSFWMVLVGILWLLDSWDILRWGHSWPFFLIASGVLVLLRRAAFVGVAAPYAQPPATPAPPADPGTSIVPKPYYPDSADQERQ